jgi:hypothetical protein
MIEFTLTNRLNEAGTCQPPFLREKARNAVPETTTCPETFTVRLRVKASGGVDVRSSVCKVADHWRNRQVASPTSEMHLRRNSNLLRNDSPTCVLRFVFQSLVFLSGS